MQESFFKILMVGPKGVGKSCLLHYTQNCEFNPTLKPTVGADFCIKEIGKEEGARKIKLQIWDLAGSKNFKSISKGYFPDAKACVFVVDNTRAASFDTDGWKEFLWEWESKNSGETIGSYVVALNKADLKGEVIIQTKNLIDTPLEWVIDKNIPVIKTSAKTGQGINDLFALLTNMLIYREDINLTPQSINFDNVVYVPDSWSPEKRNRLNLREKEEALLQSAEISEEELISQETGEITYNTQNHVASNVEGTQPNSEPLNTNPSKYEDAQKISGFREEKSTVKEISQYHQPQESHESVEKFGTDPQVPQKPIRSIGDSTIKKLIFGTLQPQSLEFSTKEELKETVIDHFCPDSNQDRIKRISELTFDKLREIIQENIEEKEISDISEIDRYFISFKIFNYFALIDESIRCLDQIISIVDPTGKRDWKAFAANQCAGILKEQKKYNEAIHYYKEALKAQRKMNDLEHLPKTLNNLGSVHYKLEKYSKALKYFREALRVDKKLGNISSQANREYWIGAIFSKINKKQNALSHLKNAYKLYKELGHHEEAEEVRSFMEHIEVY